MAKTTYDICLHHGVDKQAFIDSFDPDTEASLHKRLERLECCISMNIEDSFLETFQFLNSIPIGRFNRFKIILSIDLLLYI